MIKIEICLDAHNVGVRYGGNETYFRNLIDTLSDIYADEINFRVFVTNDDWLPAPVRGVVLQSRSVMVQRAVEIPYYILREKPSLVHSPTVPPLFTLKTKNIITIHDVLFREFPEFYPTGMRNRLNLMTGHAVNAADGIITVSEYSKRMLVTEYGVSSDKIVVTYNAPDRNFVKYLNVHDHAPSIDRPYFLFVGTVQPRKNIGRLVRAFRQSGLFPDFNLVIAGNLGWKFEDDLSELNRSVGQDGVVFVRNVNQLELAMLYKYAYALCYTPIAEGFGIPLVEAMAAGIPIISSTGTSLDEVTGDAALLVDPMSEDQIADAMVQLANDGCLFKSLAAKSRERMRLFDWQRTARQTVEFYNKIIG